MSQDRFQAEVMDELRMQEECMTKNEALDAAMRMMQNTTIRDYVRKNHKLVFKKLDATVRECCKAQERNTWKELSDDEIDRIYCDVQDNCVKDFPSELYAAWIKAFKEKNS